MSNKETQLKMETLQRELQELLLSGEMLFQEENNRTRCGHWTTEELSMSSLRRNLREAGLKEHETQLRQLIRLGLLETCLDDGWLHLTISNDLLDQDLLDGCEWDN